MKAYSIDLRQKLIDVYENEEISQRQLAQRFCVALSPYQWWQQIKAEKITKYLLHNCKGD
jgi:transposase